MSCSPFRRKEEHSHPRRSEISTCTSHQKDSTTGGKSPAQSTYAAGTTSTHELHLDGSMGNASTLRVETQPGRSRNRDPGSVKTKRKMHGDRYREKSHVELVATEI